MFTRKEPCELPEDARLRKRKRAEDSTPPPPYDVNAIDFSAIPTSADATDTASSPEQVESEELAFASKTFMDTMSVYFDRIQEQKRDLAKTICGNILREIARFHRKKAEENDKIATKGGAFFSIAETYYKYAIAMGNNIAVHELTYLYKMHHRFFGPQMQYARVSDDIALYEKLRSQSPSFEIDMKALPNLSNEEKDFLNVISEYCDEIDAIFKESPELAALIFQKLLFHLGKEFINVIMTII